MRVLAIAQRLDELSSEGGIGRRRIAKLSLSKLAGEPLADRRIIDRGAREGLGGEPHSRREDRRAVICGHLLKQQRIILRLDDDGDACMVLGRGADHRRTADIDLLDCLIRVYASRNRLLERIEIDDQEIEGLDSMIPQGVLVLEAAAGCEQPAMDLGMERLHPAVHDLGKAGQGRDIPHCDIRLDQGSCSAAGRDDLDALSRQGLCDLDKPGLVGNGNQRTANGRHGYLFSPTRLTHNAAERDCRCADAASRSNP